MKDYKMILFALLSVMLTVGCTSKSTSNDKTYSYIQNSGEIFYTSYHIKYEYSHSLEKEILDELERFELSLNPFRKNTIITKINENEPVTPDSMFLEVFNKSLEVSEMTGGKFDITASPLIDAWGFGFKNIDNVTPELIDSLLEFVGYYKIFVNSDGIIEKKDSRVQINTSAISKGYSCDLVARLFDRLGIENYMVEIGGEIVAKGVNDKGVCWRIGVDKPINDATGMMHELQTIIALCDKSLATSGNYRNYYIKDDKKYAHTIDPQTGYPSEQDLLAVTIIADDCMTADAYATAFMAMGTEKSREVAKKIPNLHYYFFYAMDNEEVGVEYSEGFEQFFVSQDN